MVAQVVQYIELLGLRLRLLDLVRVPFGGSFGTVPELLFEKKALIPAIQQLLVSHAEPTA